MGSLKRKLVVALLAGSLVLSLVASTFVYRGLYSEARQSVVSLEKDLSEARRSLREAQLEMDAAIRTLGKTSGEVKRVDKVVTEFEEKSNKIVASRKGEAVNEKVVVVEFISDELNSLLTESYNEIFLQNDAR